MNERIKEQEQYKGMSEHTAQATKGRVRIDPVTGDVGIGTPVAQPLAVPEDFMYALKFDVAARDACEWEKVDMREHAEGNLGIGTAPAAQRTWVGLTDEEIYEYADKFLYQHGSNFGIKSFGKAIEAKLKEKND